MQGKKVPPITGSSSCIGFGDDAKSIMGIRKNSSDREFENWKYEVILQEEGLVRANTLVAGSI
jgi:hypothetical protein